MRFPHPALAAILCPLLMRGACLAGSISLAGGNAGEKNGNGWALVIPDLKASAPGVYDPVNVAPKNPFNIGSITWNDALVPESGSFDLPVTNSMCAWNFANYIQDVVNKLAVIGTGGARIVLSQITGPGLSFENGVLRNINFTADVSWTPTLNGFNASQPYFGTLTFLHGSFTWNMSSNTANWFIGATDVHFEFDLTGTVSGLQPPYTPLLLITRAGPGQVSLQPLFTQPTGNNFRIVFNDSLTGSWSPLGSPFTSVTAPSSVLQGTAGISRRFFRIELAPP